MGIRRKVESESEMARLQWIKSKSGTIGPEIGRKRLKALGFGLLFITLDMDSHEDLRFKDQMKRRRMARNPSSTHVIHLNLHLAFEYFRDQGRG